MGATDPTNWHHIKESKLFERKISSLGLSIRHPLLASLIERLYQELYDKGLIFFPPCFLADEWFSPVGIPAIGIPFYLAHPRLKRLEQKYILEVEGGNRLEFMKLARHEAGHAYTYAYDLHRKKEYRRLFGSSSEEYRDTYRPRPYSRAYVHHLDNWYAQSHPDEDFAETFAVWLTPGSQWKMRYRNWKALEKLEWIDSTMRSLRGKRPKKEPRLNPREHNGLNIKLKTYFSRKRKYFEESYPDVYDRELRILFTDNPEERSEFKAAPYLRSMHRKIVNSVARWTKEKKYTIDQLMKDLTDRCQELNLYLKKNDPASDMNVTSLITSLVMTHLFTGKFKRKK